MDRNSILFRFFAMLGLLLLTSTAAVFGQFQSEPISNTIGEAKVHSRPGSCPVKVKDDFSGFYPLLFTEDGEFYPYEKLEEDNAWGMELDNNQHMIVSCAPNYLRSFSNKKTVKFSCINGELTNELGVDKKWKDVSCELRPVEEIVATVEHCETPSHLGVEFGYVNPVTQKTMILGKACYSSDKGHTEFVHMRLKPKATPFSESAMDVEPETYFHRKQHPSGRYKIDLMKAWGDYTRNRADSSIAIMTKRFVMPQSVHLSTMKKLGWNYAFSEEGHNTWTELQNEVMTMVEKKGLVVDYFAGSHGVMRVGAEELYLGKDERFAVPEYLWMFIRSGVQSIAFVVTNKKEMSAQEEKSFAEMCTSKCDEVQWLSREFKTTHGRYVLCCDMNDARASIQEMPLVTGSTHTFLF